MTALELDYELVIFVAKTDMSPRDYAEFLVRFRAYQDAVREHYAGMRREVVEQDTRTTLPAPAPVGRVA